MNSQGPTRKPLVIFDGNCGFCRKWIDRWRADAGDALDFAPSSEVSGQFPDITDFSEALYFIAPDGTRKRAAAAVFATLAAGGRVGRLLDGAYHRVPGFAPLTESAYRLIAKNRTAASVATALVWGPDITRPTFGIANTLFLRLLALVILIAAVSYLVQAPGLVGKSGILPAGELFAAARAQLGPAGFFDLPSLLWLSPTDGMLMTLCWAAILTSLVALAGIAQPVCFLILWAILLSLTVAGRDFYGFQWDALLIEASFLAIFLSPWRIRPSLAAPDLPPLARFLAIALLFRLMFCSGVVKLSSGCPTWENLTALTFHFFTQPIPTPPAWFVDHLPEGTLRAACWLTLFIELTIPFLFFLPRVPRLAAFAATAGLQVVIAMTGNYAFFNLLTLALCLYLLDDRVFPRALRPHEPLPTARFLPKFVLIPVAAALLALSIIPTVRSFRVQPDWLEPLASAHNAIAPWRTINGYGLFAVMTTTRNEIIIQGSNDGITWEDYGFFYKPGPLDRPPPWVAPYQPRLDWQMWFAALGRFESTQWFQAFLVRILQGQPEVLALMETNPFPEKPPLFVRALLDTYTLTSPEQRKQTGNWWNREPLAFYAPQVSLPADPRDGR